MELVDSVTRLCMMNLLLHGIGDENDAELPITSKDALRGKCVLVRETNMAWSIPPWTVFVSAPRVERQRQKEIS